MEIPLISRSMVTKEALEMCLRIGSNCRVKLAASISILLAASYEKPRPSRNLARKKKNTKWLRTNQDVERVC